MYNIFCGLGVGGLVGLVFFFSICCARDGNTKPENLNRNVKKLQLQDAIHVTKIYCFDVNI